MRHSSGAVQHEPAPPTAVRRRVPPRAPDEAQEQRRLEQELRHTLSHDGFVLHYQPSILLASGATVGGEALIRWPHRKRGLVAPGLFLPVAERGPLGSHIGGWVLRTACVQAASWPDGASLAVNISPRHLADGALLGHVADALEASLLDPERLELEFPEPALLGASVDVLLSLAALRDLGVGIAFDNFGAGYASLGVLREVPLTAVKLDRSLIRSLPERLEEAAIVRAVVDSGHAFGLTVAASGIETAAQRQFLALLGCDRAQGHLFSEALSTGEMRARLVG